MLRKAIYVFVILSLISFSVFIYHRATYKLPFSNNSEMIGVKGKKAIIRLEDVSVGVYDTEDKLGKLRAIAKYLNKQGVPFQVSVIPAYKDPKNNVEISIEDTDNPQVRAFIETIKYMREMGGIIGLHGHTHQYLSEVTGFGFEFMDKWPSPYALPGYAEQRVKKALNLMEEAGIPVDYWETPHYTASLDQYKVLGNYFGLLYEPNPREKSLKNMSSWDSMGSDSQNIIFIPTPLQDVTGEKDVNKILSQLDNNDPALLASFFYHPFQEFKYMYKMLTPQGKEFYVHETDSYLHKLVNGFKERGYEFVTIYDLIGFMPAQRLTDFPPATGKILLTGDFDGDHRSDILSGDTTAGRWLVVRSQIDRAIPRNNPDSLSPPEEWLNNWGQGESKEFSAGDFNGDGKKDLVSWDKNTGEIQVALSDGSKFVSQQALWGTFTAPAGANVKLMAGDFNGNKKEDLLFWVQGENTVYVLTNNGNSFSEPKLWLENLPGAGDLIAVPGDFNGDGKKDLAIIDRATGNVQVALSNGIKFLSPKGSGDQIWIKNFASGSGWQVLAGDYDGKGADDLIAYDNVNGKWEFARSTGKEFLPENWPVSWGKDDRACLIVGDFNSDGKSDLAVKRDFGKKTVLDFALSVVNK